MATESSSRKPHTLRHAFVHFFAACYGLFIAAFLGAFSYAHLTDYGGNAFVGTLGFVAAAVVGIVIWRQTVNLNRAVEMNKVLTRKLSLKCLLAYVAGYAILFSLIGGLQHRSITLIAAAVVGALTGRLLSEFAPTTTPIRFLVSTLLAWLFSAAESVSHDTQPSFPPLMHSGHLYALGFGLLVTGMLELLFGVLTLIDSRR